MNVLRGWLILGVLLSVTPAAAGCGDAAPSCAACPNVLAQPQAVCAPACAAPISCGCRVHGCCLHRCHACCVTPTPVAVPVLMTPVAVQPVAVQPMMLVPACPVAAPIACAPRPDCGVSAAPQASPDCGVSAPRAYASAQPNPPNEVSDRLQNIEQRLDKLERDFAQMMQVQERTMRLIEPQGHESRH